MQEPKSVYALISRGASCYRTFVQSAGGDENGIVKPEIYPLILDLIFLEPRGEIALVSGHRMTQVEYSIPIQVQFADLMSSDIVIRCARRRLTPGSACSALPLEYCTKLRSYFITRVVMVKCFQIKKICYGFLTVSSNDLLGETRNMRLA